MTEAMVFGVPFSVTSIGYTGNIVVTPGGRRSEAIIHDIAASDFIVYDLVSRKASRRKYSNCGKSGIEGRGLVGDYVVVWGRGFYSVYLGVCEDPVYELENVAITSWGVDSLGLYHLVRSRRIGEMLVVVTMGGYSVFRLGHKRRRKLSYSNGVVVMEYDGYSVIVYGDEYVEVPIIGLVPLGVLGRHAALLSEDGWVYVVDGYNVERVMRCGSEPIVVPLPQGSVVVVCKERGLMSFGGIVDKAFLEVVGLVEGERVCVPSNEECLLKLRLSPIIGRAVKPRMLYPLIVLPLAGKALIMHAAAPSFIALPAGKPSAPPCVIGVDGECKSLEGLVVDIDWHRLRRAAGQRDHGKGVIVERGVELEAMFVTGNAAVEAPAALVSGNAWGRVLRERLYVTPVPGDNPRITRELVELKHGSINDIDLKIIVRLAGRDVILSRDSISVKLVVDSNLEINDAITLEGCYLREAIRESDHRVLLTLRVKPPYKCLLQLGLDNYWAVLDISEGVKNIIENRLGIVSAFSVEPGALCVIPSNGSIIIGVGGEEFVVSSKVCLRLRAGVNRVNILDKNGMREFTVYGMPEAKPMLRLEGGRLCIDASRGVVVNLACGSIIAAKPAPTCVDLAEALAAGGKCSIVALWLGGNVSLETDVSALLKLAVSSALALSRELGKLAKNVSSYLVEAR